MSFGATHVLHTKIATLLIESFFIQPHCEMPWLSEVPQKMCCWHVGCWFPPKKSCKSSKVLLKTDLVVASTVRRHWSSKTWTPKLYTCRDVIAYRLSDHASTCQRCVFFSCSILQLLLKAPKCPQMNYRTVIHRQRGNGTRQRENDVFLGDITWPHTTPRS